MDGKGLGGCRYGKGASVFVVSYRSFVVNEKKSGLSWRGEKDFS